MIINGSDLLQRAPIKDMINEKRREHGVSWGLSEAGYDIRVKQDIVFYKPNNKEYLSGVIVDGNFHKGTSPLPVPSKSSKCHTILWALSTTNPHGRDRVCRYLTQ